MQLEEVSRLEQENALLASYLEASRAGSDVAQMHTISLTEEQKSEVATAEVMRAQSTIDQVRLDHEAKIVGTTAELAMLEARMAETATDTAHFKRRVISEVDPHIGKILADRLLRFLADCRKARLAEIDICTLQTASMKVGMSDAKGGLWFLCKTEHINTAGW